MTGMRKHAKDYLIDIKAIDLPKLKASKLKDLPAIISVRSERPGLVLQQEQRLLLFAEAYARYLFFTNEVRFPDLVEECQRFQKMRKGKSNPRSGLIRCILGLDPDCHHPQERTKVSEFYLAFRRLRKEQVYPESLVKDGDCVSDILHPGRKRNKQSDRGAGLDSKVHTKGDLFGVGVFRKNSNGEMIINKDLVFDIETMAEAVDAFQAAQKYWKDHKDW